MIKHVSSFESKISPTYTGPVKLARELCSTTYSYLLVYIDLARAKSEVHVNIYSLLKKKNVKSCNANQAATAMKTAKKKTIGLISKQNNFAREAHFFVHFFAVVLHDDNVKLPETS